jgi:hypothetical protein
LEKYSGPLSQHIAETVARFKASPGVSGIVLVVFTDDFRKITVANTVPHELQAHTLRAAADAVAPPSRLLVPPL